GLREERLHPRCGRHELQRARPVLERLLVRATESQTHRAKNNCKWSPPIQVATSIREKWIRTVACRDFCSGGNAAAVRQGRCPNKVRPRAELTWGARPPAVMTRS